MEERIRVKVISMKKKPLTVTIITQSIIINTKATYSPSRTHLASDSFFKNVVSLHHPSGYEMHTFSFHYGVLQG